MASTATILLAVLSLQMALNGYMACSGFLGIMGFVVFVAGKMRRNPESSLTSSASSGINYEVFLNFRGAETRNGFTSHLYCKLADAGIQVFKDDKNLTPGKKISPELIEVIKRSSISIAILSSDYASSKYCLMELQQMWECKKSNKQTIIPIFYDISPHDVKNQAGDFEESFRQHKYNGVNKKTIKAWKSALQRLGKLGGFDLEKIYGGKEALLVEEVVRRVSKLLNKDCQLVPDELVGIDDHVQEMMTKLGVVYSHGQVMEVCGGDTRVVGICGPPGVGKATLAKVVFNEIHKQEFFHGCCFLEVANLKGVSDKREIWERVKDSQQWLIAKLGKKKPKLLQSSDEGINKISNRFKRMKVLIVLDHVQTEEQIEALVGKLTWFDSGSRIIVTTDKNDVFNGFKDQAAREAVDKHKVEPMRDHHALQLFRKLAFQGGAPQEVSEYDSLSIDIVKAIGGLRSTIVLHASSLRKKGENLRNNREKIKLWKSTLKLIEEQRKHPDDMVEAAFWVSYESLDEYTKDIFLDIACFFNGKDEKIPSYMWKSCGYDSFQGIQHLRDMYLLEIGETNELRMQYKFRDFGRKFVEDKNGDKRCRFWNHSDALSIPNDGEGARNVEGIGLTVEDVTSKEADITEDGPKVCFRCEEFREMSKLRYLRLERAKIEGNTENLPPSLRWLDWQACHSIPELCNAFEEVSHSRSV